MRIDVTPLGSVGRSAAAVARSVVDYLEGGRGDPGTRLLTTGDGGAAAAYYGDSAEGPGRWIGAGADHHGLVGVVDRDAFARLLEGRHPHTGARLLTARGSSQRAHLAVGAAARFDALGTPLYEAADAASLLGLTRGDVDEMIAAGAAGDVAPDDRGALATVTVDGVAYVPDGEISRHLQLATSAPTSADILAGGDGTDRLSVTEAAAALGVSARYVRRLCAAPTDGGRAKLAAARDDRGRWTIERSDLAEFAASRKPPVARVGYDVTLTVEKSFAVVMMLADPAVRRHFTAALDTANATAIAYLDRHAAVARRRGVVVGSEGLVGASYLHATSRTLDPHPHRHNVIANAVVDDEVGVRALDARALHRHATAASGLATAAARWELRDLGLGWWQRDDGMWEIAGLDETVIAEFSTRHHDIREVRDALARDLGRPLTEGEDDTAWATTRPDKTAVDPAVLAADWRARAARVGFDLAACLARADRAVTFEVLPTDRVHHLFGDLADPERGVCATTDRFGRGDVIRAIADWALPDRHGRLRKVLLPPAEIEALADRFLGCEHVVALAPDLAVGGIRRRDGHHVGVTGSSERLFSTVELLRVQQRAITTWRDGAGVGTGTVDAATVEEVLGADGELTDEQRDLVRHWCTSGDLANAAIGRAGTGKTTAMRAAAAAWRRAGYRVIGAAVKGEAARQLAADADIDADTVALRLARLRHDPLLLDRRSVVIVDEGSTLGDRDLAALLDACARAGAALRIVGDPAQHHSVPAGGCWSWLAANTRATVELATSHRLRDPAERARADLVRDGRVEAAIDILVAAGQLDLSDSDVETYTKMLTRWHTARHRGEAHPMVHGRNRQRHVLNRLAQQLLADNGGIDTSRSVTRRDGQRLCVGDEVIARHGDRRIHPSGDPDGWLRNGTTGTIVDVHHGDTPADDRVAVATELGLLDCPRSVFDRRRGGLDLGYAVTSYAVQGQTRAVSTSAVTATTTRAELYVDMTRGQRGNQLYATRQHQPGDPDSDRHLPAIDSPLVEELTARLARGSAIPAAVADPAAARIASRPRRSFATLANARRAGEDIDDVELERAAAALRASAPPLPPGCAALFPAGVQRPHVQRALTDLAGDIALHHAAHPLRRRPATILETALGPRPTVDVDAAAGWDRNADRLLDTAAAAWSSHVDGGAPAATPRAWLRPLLAQLAAHPPTGSGTVAGRLRAVADWRQHQGIDTADDGPLGPRPSDPAAAAQWDRLTATLADGRPHRRDIEVDVA